MPTVAQLLRGGVQQLSDSSPSPRADCELLLEQVLDKPRSFFFSHADYVLRQSELEQFQLWLARRRDGEPVAYLIGSKAFYQHEFLVSPATLIPRADTELLVDTTLALLSADKPLRVADLGTGTGAVAISLALARPGWQLEAADFSEEIVALAQRNVERLHAANVHVLQSDWCDALSGRFDAIVSNPPYIAAQDAHLQRGDVRYEPSTALVSGEEGLDAIRHIVGQARDFLLPGGLLALEHGYDQAEAVQGVMKNKGYTRVATHKDLGGQDRVTLGYAD